MALEIRAAKPAEMAEFGHVGSASLGIVSDIVSAIRPEWTLCAFEDGELATTCAAWPFTMRYNGEGIPVAGITWVGTLPVYRRRGYLRKIMEVYFKSLYERGERSLAILHASQMAIYHRYDFAAVSTRNAYDAEPGSLEFAVDRPVAGYFREVKDDEFGMLVELYRSFRAERTGYLHRGRIMWERGVLAPPPAGGLLSKVVYEEDGEPLGYLVYSVENLQEFGELPRLRLTIRDLTWLTAPAYRAIWAYLCRMDIVDRIVWRRVPPDDPLPHLLLEPRLLNLTSHDGIMGRLVDVERALPVRSYPGEGDLVFEVVDDLCPWNQGRWHLETSAAGSSIRRATKSPQLVIPVSTLAMLVFGRISATEAARMGRLDVLEPGALPVWDEVMRTAYRPFCADSF